MNKNTSSVMGRPKTEIPEYLIPEITEYLKLHSLRDTASKFGYNYMTLRARADELNIPRKRIQYTYL